MLFFQFLNVFSMHHSFVSPKRLNGCVDHYSSYPSFKRALASVTAHSCKYTYKSSLQNVFCFCPIICVSHTYAQHFGRGQLVQFFLCLPILCFAPTYQGFYSIRFTHAVFALCLLCNGKMRKLSQRLHGRVNFFILT